MIHLSVHITEYFKPHFYSLNHLSGGSAAGTSFQLCDVSVNVSVNVLQTRGNGFGAKMSCLSVN